MNEFENNLARQPLKSIPPEWRAQILHQARVEPAPDVRSTSFAWLRELLWPAPRAWGALAAAWLVIAGFHFVTPHHGPMGHSAVASNPVTSVPEQQRELARLLETNPQKLERSPADRPRSARHVPHSFA